MQDAEAAEANHARLDAEGGVANGAGGGTCREVGGACKDGADAGKNDDTKAASVRKAANPQLVSLAHKVCCTLHCIP